ncbi:MAG: transposase [Thermoplasmatales archaeon]
MDVQNQTRVREKENKTRIKVIFTKKGKVWIQCFHILKIESMLEIIETEEAKIKEIDNEINRPASTNENKRILTPIPGIGRYSAALIYAEIGKIERFPSLERLCGYAKMVPSTTIQGTKHIMGR